MGFALDWNRNLVVQNRGHYVQPTDHAQFKPLSPWLDKHRSAIRKLLDQDPQYPERYILYGEWVVAKHSIPYTHLPDQFLAFDLYDRYTKTFVSSGVLRNALRGTRIRQVPLIYQVTALSRADMLLLIERKSAFYDGRVEGVYVRIENKDRTETVERGKVVRSDFISGDEHWAKGPLVLNGMAQTSINT